MGDAAGRLGRNLRWLLGSEFGARALGFAYTALVARLLGLEGFGLLSLSLVYAEIFALAIGMSFHEVLVREVLQGGRDPERLLARMVRFQLLAAIPGIGIALGLGSLYEGPSQWLLPLAAGIGLTRGLARSYLAVSVAQEDFRPRSIYGVLDRMTALAGGLLLWLLSFGLVGLLTTLLVGSILTVFYASASSRKQMPALSRVSKSAPAGFRAPGTMTTRQLLREGFSFSALRWMGVAHNRIDTLIIQSLIGPAALGVYSAAYRLMEVFKIVPNLAEQTLFPSFSKLPATGPERSRAVSRAFQMLLVLMVPLVVCAWTLGDAAVDVVFGDEFLAAATPWGVLMSALAFIALSRPFLVLLRASGELRTANILTGASVLVNVGLNLLWIPRYGPTGAALATLSSEALFVALCVLRKRELSRGIGRRVLRVLPAVIVAVALAVLLRPTDVWLAAVTSGLAYLGVVWFVGLSTEDRRDLRAALRGRS